MLVKSLDPEDSPEKGMATHSNVLAWRIPWTEEPGGLQSTGQKELDEIEETQQARLSQSAAHHST